MRLILSSLLLLLTFSHCQFETTSGDVPGKQDRGLSDPSQIQAADISLTKSELETDEGRERLLQALNQEGNDNVNINIYIDREAPNLPNSDGTCTPNQFTELINTLPLTSLKGALDTVRTLCEIDDSENACSEASLPCIDWKERAKLLYYVEANASASRDGTTSNSSDVNTSSNTSSSSDTSSNQGVTKLALGISLKSHLVNEESKRCVNVREAAEYKTLAETNLALTTNYIQQLCGLGSGSSSVRQPIHRGGRRTESRDNEDASSARSRGESSSTTRRGNG